MTKQNKLQKLRSAIISEIPDNKKIGNVPLDSTLRLADVLRVYDENENYEKEKRDWLLDSSQFGWNLSKNDLNLQSKETIDFLTKIILKKNG